MTRLSPSPRGTNYGTVPVVDMEDQLCQLDPQMWEASRTDTPSKAELVRIRYAQRACGRCPALDACRKYLAGWSHPEGVVAGRAFREGVEILNKVAGDDTEAAA